MVLKENILMANKGANILIVDDEDAIRYAINIRLSREGYRCSEASNSDNALARLKVEPAELVILDIKMPGKSGADLLPELKALYPEIAVIMATALTDSRIAIHCMKQGAYDYVTKPFDLDEIVIVVERALDKRRLEIENRDYQLHLEQKVREQAGKIRQSFLNAITSLAHALEAKDAYTVGHSQTVTTISIALAKEMGLPTEKLEKIRLAGLVHDIGKIGIAEGVLNKPGALTSNEYIHVKTHPEIAEHILEPVVEDGEILEMVRHHHERYDGNGYPDKLKGEEISLGARILMVADSYHAMTSRRPYRESMSFEKACEELRRCRGSQFCPVVIDAFLNAGKSVVPPADSEISQDQV